MRGGKKMTFTEHIVEFRKRLRISVIVFLLAFFITYAFSETILIFLWTHFFGQFSLENGDVSLLATSVMSGFVTQLNISLILAATASIPIFIYEMFLFIEPSLHKKHRLIAAKIIISAIVLFVAGAAFVYYIMLPILLVFFIQNNTSLGITNYFSVEAFFEFIMMNLFVGGIIFQTPLIITIANRIGLLPKKWLVSSRRLVYIAILILAGIITPDHSIVSQLILGLAMALLFEISLLFCR